MNKPDVEPKDVIQVEQEPVRRVPLADHRWFFDFGRAAFGTVTLYWPEAMEEECRLVVHLGEKLAAENRIDHQPDGHVRYRRLPVTVQAGQRMVQVEIPPDERNTGPAAILMPPEIGEVLPFRYVEIELPGQMPPPALRRLAAQVPFNDEAASFSSSSQVLDDVWQLCKYSIKATTFCGVYVDGDRERIPYEADAYLNQLSHYCVDTDYGLARRTLDHLIDHPSWPTEWQFQTIFMAWLDYLYTGRTDKLKQHYQALKARLLLPLARQDGLISTQDVPASLLDELGLDRLQDIVDWPGKGFGGEAVPGERDGYDMRPVNTVVNAFHFEALNQMNRIARILGESEDRECFRLQAQKVRWSFNRVFLDVERGFYRDGADSPHASLHANMFALAFGLVPQRTKASVVDFIKSRGMACSVYAAQYLLDTLYQHGEADYALSLMTATHDRSWAHMLYETGSTITLEAWAPHYKPNLDWNHAWGAAPANLIPRWVLGVQPQKPGWKRASIRPQLGNLAYARGTVPTWRGPIHVEAEQTADKLSLHVEGPDDLPLHIWLPGAEKPQALPGGKHHLET